MQNIKNEGNINGEVMKHRQRHVVAWSLEEDDILREQIRIHRTENWVAVASHFKDKTTRQCRRRWYTYLNSDLKKGGWSLEEDTLLCEAHKIFGNKWTEIAKVVPGRTDNAVKNRFSILCKKRQKNETLAKENTTSYINTNNKRVILEGGFNTTGLSETITSLKRMRKARISDLAEKCNNGEKLPGECGTTKNQELRAPLTVLVQNFHDVGNVPTQHHVNKSKENPHDTSNDKIQGSFLKKDDLRVVALMQQAELLSSLAVKVNMENTGRNLENVWEVLQEFLYQRKGSDMLDMKISDTDFQFERFKDMVEDLRSGSNCNKPSWKPPDLFEESPESSVSSAGSTLVSQTAGDKTKQSLGKLCALDCNTSVGSQSIPIGYPNGIANCDNVLSGVTNTSDMLPSGNDLNDHDGIATFSSTEFGSLPVTPIFRSLAAGVPSPKFSESERLFLLKALRVELPSCNPSNNTSPPPPCKRALLQNL